MLVSIPVHNLSRRILIAENKTEPIQVGKHDTLFVILSSLRGERIPITRAVEVLHAEVTFDLHPRLARYVAAKPYSIGFAILKYHKEIIHQHVASVLDYNPKASAWAVLKDYLDHFGINEDDYPMETAYKNWQRFGWNFQKKNGQKRSHLRRKTAVNIGKVATPKKHYYQGPRPCTPVMEAPELDAIAATAAAALSTSLKGLPDRFPFWVQYYTYIRVGKHSKRTAAKTLSVAPQTVYRGYCNIRTRAESSQLFATLLNDALPVAP